VSRLWGNPVGTNDVVGTFRARESFSYDGRLVAKDEVLSGDDPVALAVLDKRPDLLFVTTRMKEA
jgi:hypothetical protein